MAVAAVIVPDELQFWLYGQYTIPIAVVTTKNNKAT
jgi:hypothetical protein